MTSCPTPTTFWKKSGALLTGKIPASPVLPCCIHKTGLATSRPKPRCFGSEVGNYPGEPLANPGKGRHMPTSAARSLLSERQPTVNSTAKYQCGSQNVSAMSGCRYTGVKPVTIRVLVSSTDEKNIVQLADQNR